MSEVNQTPPLRLLPTIINGTTPSRRKFRVLVALGVGDQPKTNIDEAFTYEDNTLVGIIEITISKDGKFRLPSQRVPGTGFYTLVPY